MLPLLQACIQSFSMLCQIRHPRVWLLANVQLTMPTWKDQTHLKCQKGKALGHVSWTFPDQLVVANHVLREVQVCVVGWTKL